MKVLIVSHNVLSPTSNMGRTLMSYFDGTEDMEMAQFYIHDEVPVNKTICRNYYRFTDKDAIRSLNPFGTYGTVFGEADICPERLTSRMDSGLLSKLYQVGAKRTAFIYTARNILWKFSRWNTHKFWKWVEDFSPDVIFFASGDYGFMYDIAHKIAEYVNKPLVVVCVDDYYLYNRNADSFLGRFQHRLFLKAVHKVMVRAVRIFTICESLKEAYEKLFQIPCDVLHTAALAMAETADTVYSGQISYLGNLGLGRAEQLATMGRAVRRHNGWIDVYSHERNPEYLRNLTEENGVRFHGAVGAEEVLKIMASSKAVIHTESFDPKFQDITRYSVSTKIADSLMNGPCIIAYGPEGIASIDYLKENRAAYVISDSGDLETGLHRILSDDGLREEIVSNARVLAEKNHHPRNNPANVCKWLEEVCEEWEKTR